MFQIITTQQHYVCHSLPYTPVRDPSSAPRTAAFQIPPWGSGTTPPMGCCQNLLAVKGDPQHLLYPFLCLFGWIVCLLVLVFSRFLLWFKVCEWHSGVCVWGHRGGLQLWGKCTLRVTVGNFVCEAFQERRLARTSGRRGRTLVLNFRLGSVSFDFLLGWFAQCSSTQPTDLM